MISKPNKTLMMYFLSLMTTILKLLQRRDLWSLQPLPTKIENIYTMLLLLSMITLDIRILNKTILTQKKEY